MSSLYNKLTCSGRIIDEAAAGCFDAKWVTKNPDQAADLLLLISRNLASVLDRRVAGWNYPADDHPTPQHSASWTPLDEI